MCQNSIDRLRTLSPTVRIQPVVSARCDNNVHLRQVVYGLHNRFTSDLLEESCMTLISPAMNIFVLQNAIDDLRIIERIRRPSDMNITQ